MLKNHDIISVYISTRLHFLCSEWSPSGALTLDMAMGGGFPKGRIVEVRGSATAHCPPFNNCKVGEARPRSPFKLHRVFQNHASRYGTLTGPSDSRFHPRHRVLPAAAASYRLDRAALLCHDCCQT